MNSLAKMNVDKLLVLVIVFLFKSIHIASSNSFKKHDQSSSSLNLLEKIIAETSYSNINTNRINQQQNDFNKNVYLFIDKVAHTGIRNTCDTRLIQSDVQVKMRKLKSIISTCNGYCRLAMALDGHIYGAKDFNLDTIWSRVDVSDEVLSTNKALLGAYYIKFVLADKYLCTTKNGELYSSKQESKGCLWFNDWPRLISATYDINLVIQKHCKLNVLNDNTDTARFYSNKRYNDETSCKNNLNITSGFSPDLQKFFRTCQSSLIAKEQQQQHHQHHYASSTQRVHTTKLHHEPYLFKPIAFMHSSTMATSLLSTSTKNAVITKKTFNDDPNQSSSSELGTILVEKAKSLCKDYIYDEIIQKKLSSYDYNVYDANLNNIPKLCIDYLIYLNKTQESKESNQLVEYNYIVNYDESLLLDSLVVSQQKNKFKKCFSFRNTPLYQKCMDKYYKCYKFNNDIEKLKKCRKKHGITMPKKKPNTLYYK